MHIRLSYSLPPQSEKKWSKSNLTTQDGNDISSHESDPLYMYLKQISRYPLLSAEEERKLSREISDLKEKLEKLTKKTPVVARVFRTMMKVEA